MGINIYAGTNELDVNMSLKDTSFIASMDTKIMPMNINMSLNGKPKYIYYIIL